MARRNLFIVLGIPLAAILIAGIFYGVGHFRQHDQHPPDIVPRTSFSSAEQLTYSIALRGVPSGSIVIRISSPFRLPDGREVNEIRSSSKTTDTFSAVFFGRGTTVTLVDAATLLPYEYEFKSASGAALGSSEEKHEMLVFDRMKNVLQYFAPPKEGTADDKLVLRRERPIPKDAQHWSSVIASMRQMPLPVGSAVKLVIVDKKHDVEMTCNVLREEPYTASDGTKRTAFVVETVYAPPVDPKEGESEAAARERKPPISATLWIDKDGRFPVRIDATTKIGKISATLTERSLNPAAADNEGDGNHTGSIPVNTAPGKAAP